jgi:hypothetical protein
MAERVSLGQGPDGAIMTGGEAGDDSFRRVADMLEAGAEVISGPSQK